MLRELGVDWNYYLNGDQALLMVVIAAVWKQISYNFLFFLAGLQSIPKSLIEAAAIDGTGPVSALLDHRISDAVATTFFLLVVNVVYAFFDTFAIVDATTQGGPSGATEILVFKVYQDGVQAWIWRIRCSIGDTDGHCHRVDGRSIPLRRAQGSVLMLR